MLTKLSILLIRFHDLDPLLPKLLLPFNSIDQIHVGPIVEQLPLEGLLSILLIRFVREAEKYLADQEMLSILLIRFRPILCRTGTVACSFNSIDQIRGPSVHCPHQCVLARLSILLIRFITEAKEMVRRITALSILLIRFGARMYFIAIPLFLAFNSIDQIHRREGGGAREGSHLSILLIRFRAPRLHPGLPGETFNSIDQIPPSPSSSRHSPCAFNSIDQIPRIAVPFPALPFILSILLIRFQGLGSGLLLCGLGLSILLIRFKPGGSWSGKRVAQTFNSIDQIPGFPHTGSNPPRRAFNSIDQILGFFRW